MSRFYLDTSALAKLYVQEQGSDVLVDLASDPDHSFTVLSVARVELYSALRRRERDGDLSPDGLRDIVEDFESHWNGFFVIQPIGDALLEAAVELLARRPLRAYDALQLAGCLLTPVDTIFACADRALLQAASAEGRQTLDPTV